MPYNPQVNCPACRIRIVEIGTFYERPEFECTEKPGCILENPKDTHTEEEGS